MASEPLKLYELVTKLDDPYYSPNTMKTRLCLVAKGVPFVTVPVTINTLRGDVAARSGIKRPMVPLLEFPDGRFIQDSFKIAQWLDEAFPESPSLFLPSEPGQVDPSSAGYKTAVAFGALVAEGYGNSDPQWSCFFELAAPVIAEHMSKEGGEKSDYSYFTSDEKLGFKDAWKWVTSHDIPTLVARTKASLLPCQTILALPDTQYLTSPSVPGWVDFVLYGRYYMVRCGDQALADELFDGLRDWRLRLEEKYKDELAEVFEREKAWT